MPTTSSLYMILLHLQHFLMLTMRVPLGLLRSLAGCTVLQRGHLIIAYRAMRAPRLWPRFLSVDCGERVRQPQAVASRGPCHLGHQTRQTCRF